MNPQENRDYDRRLQELERELESNQRQPLGDAQSGQPLHRSATGSPADWAVFAQMTSWFNNLPKAAKVAVVIIAALVGLSLLRTVLQLVTSLVSLAVLGVILYLVYKFFIASQSPK